MTLSLKAIVSLLVAGALFIGILAGSVFFRSQTALGSVNVSNDYMATTTAPAALYGNTITTTAVIKRGVGTLGSVVITGAAGAVNIYNATTTNASLRASNKATSTLLIATLPASLAAGVYTFDVQYTDGLLIDLASGAMPTSTVTYR